MGVGQGVEGGRVLHAHGPGAGHGRQGVLHVVLAKEAQVDVAGPFGGAAGEVHAVGGGRHGGGADVCRGVVQGEGGHLGAAGPGGRESLVGVVAGEVDDAAVGQLEDAQLGGQVVLEAGMLHGRDVVVADVEEARHREREAQHAVVLEGLAGDLHDHAPEAGAAGVGQVAPEVGRLRGGVGALKGARAVKDGVGAKDGAGLGPRGVEEHLQQVGRGGLAFGAGDAHDLQVAVGASPGGLGDPCHGGADVGAEDAGHVRGHGGEPRGRVRRAEVGRGPCLEGGREELRPEGRPLADEDVSGGHLARVTGGTGHGHGGVALQGGVEAVLVEEGGELSQGDGVHGSKYGRGARGCGPFAGRHHGVPTAAVAPAWGCCGWGGAPVPRGVEIVPTDTIELRAKCF